MEILTLIIALAALAIAILALARTGGIEELRRQVEGLGPRTAGIRERTAEALDRLAQRLRRQDKAPPTSPTDAAEPREEPR